LTEAGGRTRFLIGRVYFLAEHQPGSAGVRYSMWEPDDHERLDEVLRPPPDPERRSEL